MESHQDPGQRKKNTDALFKMLLDKHHQDENAIDQLLQCDIDYTQLIEIHGFSYTPIHLAARERKWVAVTKIASQIQKLETPMKPNDCIQLGAAVFRAVSNKQTTIVETLLNNALAKQYNKSLIINWKLDAYPHDRATHEAVRNNDPETLDLLLKYGYPLTDNNGEKLPAELALEERRYNCLEIISQHTQLSSSYFTAAPVKQLVKMMLKGIRLSAPGYHDAKIQEKREDIINHLFSLQNEKELKIALEAANDKNTLLGDYILNYKQGFLQKLFNNELSAEKMQIRINAKLRELAPRTPKSSTTSISNEMGIDDTSLKFEDGVELSVVARTPLQDFDSSSESDTAEENIHDASRPHSKIPSLNRR